MNQIRDSASKSKEKSFKEYKEQKRKKDNKNIDDGFNIFGDNDAREKPKTKFNTTRKNKR